MVDRRDLNEVQGDGKISPLSNIITFFYENLVSNPGRAGAQLFQL